MPRVRVPPLHDLVRIANGDLAQTKRNLIAYATAGRPPWTYETVRRIAPPLLAGEVPLDAALHACMSQGHPSGRRANADVARLVALAGEGRKLQCYDLKPRYFALRQDLEVKVPADFYLVENKHPIVFWLQPRKGFALNDAQRRLLATVVYMRFAVEWDEFSFEMLDLSPMPGMKDRVLNTFRFDGSDLLPEEEIMKVMQVFADAFDELRRQEDELADTIDDAPQPPPGPGPLFE